MITGTVWGITLLVVGLLLSLGAMQLLLAAVFPEFVARTARVLGRRGGGLVWNLIRGVAAAFVLVALFAAFANGGPGLKVLTVLPFFGAVTLLVCGLAGVSLAVGERLPSPADAGRPWRALVRGAITTELAFLVPFVGWFFLLPVAAVLGLGGATGALFRRRAGDVPPDPVEPSDALELDEVGV